jgi:L,D-transpeptidase YcbB
MTITLRHLSIHRLRLTILLAVLCLLPAAASADNSEQQTLMQQRLEHFHFGIREKVGPDMIYAPEQLLDLYRSNQFQLLWTREESIDQLLAAIRASAQEGLIPDDYHLQSIVSHGKLLQSNPSTGSRVDYDILLSDAMVLLGHHKRFGKVDPQMVEERLNLATPAQQISLSSLYLNAIRSGSVQRMLEKLSPDHQVYAELQQALVNYRKIASKGGWPSVPLGPSLKPDMRHDRVIALRKRLVASGDLAQIGPDPSLFDEALAKAVKAFQTRHHLEADGVAGKTTMLEMNISVAERINQLRVNLHAGLSTICPPPA